MKFYRRILSKTIALIFLIGFTSNIFNEAISFSPMFWQYNEDFEKHKEKQSEKLIPLTGNIDTIGKN